MIDERERLVLRERREPERELAEAHRERILVDSVKAPLRDEAPRMRDDVGLLSRDLRDLAAPRPRGHDLRAEKAACGDEERTRSHGRIADLEAQDPLRIWRIAHRGK